MRRRLIVSIAPTSADWTMTAELDDVVIFEESYLDEWDARAAADEFETKLVRNIAPQAFEQCARVCDAAASELGSAESRALARSLAQRIRRLGLSDDAPPEDPTP